MTMLSPTPLMTRMLDIVRQAGGLAMDMIQDSSPTLKGDDSVLTRADLAVSRLVRESLDDLLQTGEHILLDEEDNAGQSYFSDEIVQETPYIWAVDPIDGTRCYANHLPTFGVSLGLMKDRRPWLGAVYLPYLRELYYADGRQAYFQWPAFSGDAHTRPVVPVEQTISKRSVFLISESFIEDYEWDSSLCQIMIPSCAVTDLCWPAVGRACGCFFRANIWDLAGAWPVFEAAGLQLRSLSTGEPLTELQLSLFEGRAEKAWKLRDNYILSTDAHFPILQKAISLKGKK